MKALGATYWYISSISPMSAITKKMIEPRLATGRYLARRGEGHACTRKESGDSEWGHAESGESEWGHKESGESEWGHAA
jgi:hypothetical protein